MSEDETEEERRRKFEELLAMGPLISTGEVEKPEVRLPPGELIEGLKKLRAGALLTIIVCLLLSVSVVVWVLGFFLPLISILIALLSLLCALILGLMSFVLWFMAAGCFKRYNPDRLGVGRLGMTLEVIGLIITIVGLAVIINSIIAGMVGGVSAGFEAFILSLLGSIAVVILGVILIFVGSILFAMMLRRLPEQPKVDERLGTAGTLLLIVTILGLIPFVGLISLILSIIAIILIYIASGASIEALE